MLSIDLIFFKNHFSSENAAYCHFMVFGKVEFLEISFVLLKETTCFHKGYTYIALAKIAEKIFNLVL